MKNLLIKRLNKLRKINYLSNPLYQTQKKYAFIGIGMHSLSNLYPIIHHFGITLKYISTQSSTWENRMLESFPDTRFIHSIEEIADDPEVEGVLICTSPSAHFDILKKLLGAGKKVFIEKPPCRHLSELEHLIQIYPDAICKVGLQRRYWRGNKIILKKLSSAQSYRQLFHFGALMEGDPFTELFIHALDYCKFLFGDYKLLSNTSHKDNNRITVQFHVQHHDGISGLIELSTHFSWNAPTDQMTINCKNETLHVQYPLQVKGEEKPRRPLNLPTERLLNQPTVTKEYFTAHQLIIPAPEVNTLVLQGFYDEIKTFIDIAEGRIRNKTIQNDLPGLKTIYEIMEALRQ